MAMLLLMRLMQQVNELPVKPPVTLGLMGLQGWLFMNPPPFLDRVSDVCMSAFSVIQMGELYRIIAASLFHLDAYHLYYNMSSFLVKGVALEQRLGSPLMLAMTLGLLVATNIIHLALSVALDDWMTCSLGFSGVLFALKVIVTYDLQDPNQDAYFYGIRLPSKHLVWVEIAFIQMVMPQASMLGHASGALAGFGFLALRRLAPALLRWVPREAPRTYGSGFWGAPRQQRHQEPTYGNAAPPYGNAAPEPPRARPQPTAPSGASLSADELRRRRVDRYAQSAR
ncbi:Rhomboid-related protein 4 [Hondaea fermentalgiana]|uniref:Rhomboid-related protein 4 n=1 Tax=Hondaea fermentalgiana TaxID=2315210 RepID=A0A2R5G7E8_9STRA|nr:Rhomboid-related protein 4 [Hondaea fermentalgiana]|eukprot:GBG26465.1 Rhomboid-related protein 4 [Hondaea fermentalgiana]